MQHFYIGYMRVQRLVIRIQTEVKIGVLLVAFENSVGHAHALAHVSIEVK